MNKSESIKDLAAALSKAQGAMRAAIKDSANPFFKSKYSDLASVIEAIRKPLSENGLAFVQGTDFDDSCGVIVETMLMHSSGEWISARIKMVPTKNDPQGIGSCVTYAKRYGLQALVGIPSDDDDGNTASGNAVKPESFKSIAEDVWGKMDQTEKEFLTSIADEAKNLIAKGNAQAALDFIHAKNLEADERTALNYLFDSKQRAAMKQLKRAA